MLKVVAGIETEISEPYAAGMILSEVDAKILNKVRAKNFTNAIRSKIEKMRLEDLSELEIKNHISDMDSCYVLSATSILDPIEREAIKIATDLVKAHLAQDGRKINQTPAGYSDDEWQTIISQEIERVAETAEVISVAQTNVELRRKGGTSLANSLGLKE